MYNTHPKLYYKILGKKVRIILEILRYSRFGRDTNGELLRIVGAMLAIGLCNNSRAIFHCQHHSGLCL